MSNDRRPGKFYYFETFPYIMDSYIPYKTPTLSLGQVYPIIFKLLTSGSAKKPNKPRDGYSIPTIIGDLYFRQFDPSSIIGVENNECSTLPNDRLFMQPSWRFYMLNVISKINYPFRGKNGMHIQYNPEQYSIYPLIRSFNKDRWMAHFVIIDMIARVMYEKVGGHPLGLRSEDKEYFLLLVSLEKALTNEDSFSEENAWATACRYSTNIPSHTMLEQMVIKGIYTSIQETMKEVTELSNQLTTNLFGDGTEVTIQTPFACIAFILAQRALGYPDIPYGDYQKALSTDERIRELVDIINKPFTADDDNMTQDLMFLNVFKFIEMAVDVVNISWEKSHRLDAQKFNREFNRPIDSSGDWLPRLPEDEHDENQNTDIWRKRHNFAMPDGTEFEGGLDE